MPDTLQIAKSEIDSLVRHSMNCVMEENQAHVEPNTTLAWFFLGVFFIGSLYAIFRYNSVNTKYKFLENDNSRNGFWFLIFSFLLVCSVISLYNFGLIHPPNKNGFFTSHADILLVTASIIAIVGAFWAVLARIDAEKAFNKSEETVRKQDDLLNALGNNFEFNEILNIDKYVYIINKIPLSNTTVSLYIGFPCIGLLYKGAQTDFKSLKPKEALIKLTNTLKAIPKHISDNSIQGFNLNIYVLEKSEAIKIMQTHVPSERHCENEIIDFYDELDKVEKLNSQFNKFIIKRTFNPTEKLRFIAVNIQGAKETENKGFIWVADIIASEDNAKNIVYRTFDSKGFQNNDSKFIQVLESVFTT